MSLFELCASIILIAGTSLLLLIAIVVAMAIIKGASDGFRK